MPFPFIGTFVTFRNPRGRSIRPASPAWLGHARGVSEGGESREAYLSKRAPTLLRLAYQLTGDPAAAVEVVARAASRLARTSGPDVDRDRAMTGLLVRESVRRPAPPADASGFALAMPPRQRAAVVLAFGPGWDADTIAEVTRTTPRRVRHDVAGALAAMPEQRWRDLLADPRWWVAEPPDLFRRAQMARASRRHRRSLMLLGAGSLAMLLAATTVAVVRVVTAPSPPPPTATDSRLLRWPARGDLVGDHRFIDAATRLWRASATPPTDEVFVLYAGNVGVGRLAVLQALTPGGAAAVAVVGDHDISFRHPRLQLVVVSPLPRTDVPVLAVPYDGNLNIPGLTAGPGSHVDQLLVAPGVERVDERSIRGQVVGERPDFVVQPLTHGLSDPWLNLVRRHDVTAVRAYRPGRPPWVGLVLGNRVQPIPWRPDPAPPGREWDGLSHDFPAAGLADDMLWWAQVCGADESRTSLVWAGGAPGFPAGVRLERVRCGAGGAVVGHFLTGIGGSAVELASDRGSGRPTVVYAGLLQPPSPGNLSVVIVGSRGVAAVAGREVHEKGRVAVLRSADAAQLRVVLRDGRVVPIG